MKLNVIEGGASDPRESARSNVFLSATLAALGLSRAVRVRNISLRGALLDGANLPAASTAVALRRGLLSVKAEVAWQQGDQCGLRFNDPIDVGEWVRRVGHVGQQRVDCVMKMLRSAEHLPALESPSLPPDTLSAISNNLRETCERLSNISQMSVQIAEELLRLDAIAHRLEKMANDHRIVG